MAKFWHNAMYSGSCTSIQISIMMLSRNKVTSSFAPKQSKFNCSDWFILNALLYLEWSFLLKTFSIKKKSSEIRRLHWEVGYFWIEKSSTAASIYQPKMDYNLWNYDLSSDREKKPLVIYWISEVTARNIFIRCEPTKQII